MLQRLKKTRRLRMMMMARLKISWDRSQIGYPEDQRRTIRALGLRRLHQTIERDDSPTIRGMLHKVRHLISVEILEGGTK